MIYDALQDLKGQMNITEIRRVTLLQDFTL